MHWLATHNRAHYHQTPLGFFFSVSVTLPDIKKQLLASVVLCTFSQQFIVKSLCNPAVAESHQFKQKPLYEQENTGGNFPPSWHRFLSIINNFHQTVQLEKEVGFLYVRRKA